MSGESSSKITKFTGTTAGDWLQYKTKHLKKVVPLQAYPLLEAELDTVIQRAVAKAKAAVAQIPPMPEPMNPFRWVDVDLDMGGPPPPDMDPTSSSGATNMDIDGQPTGEETNENDGPKDGSSGSQTQDGTVEGGASDSRSDHGAKSGPSSKRTADSPPPQSGPHDAQPVPTIKMRKLRKLTSAEVAFEKLVYEHRMYQWKQTRDSIRESSAKLDVAKIEKTFTDLHDDVVKVLRQAFDDHITTMESQGVNSSAFKMVTWMTARLNVQEDNAYFLKAIDSLPKIPAIVKSNPSTVTQFHNSSIEILNHFERAVKDDKMTIEKALFLLCRRQLQRSLMEAGDEFSDFRKDLVLNPNQSNVKDLLGLRTVIDQCCSTFHNNPQRKQTQSSNGAAKGFTKTNESSKSKVPSDNTNKATKPGIRNGPATARPADWANPKVAGAPNWENNGPTCTDPIHRGRWVSHLPSQCFKWGPSSSTNSSPKKEASVRCGGCGKIVDHNGPCPEYAKQFAEQQKANANNGSTKKLQQVTMGEFLQGKLPNTSGSLKAFTSVGANAQSFALGSNSFETVNQNLDSGATNTSSGNRHDFDPMQLDSCHDTVRTADDRVINVDGKGLFILNSGSIFREMPNSYLMRGWSETLVSVSQLIGDTADSVIFTRDAAFLHEADKDLHHHIAQNINHSYKLLKHPYIVSAPATAFATERKAKRRKDNQEEFDVSIINETSQNSTDLKTLDPSMIHRRFGHLSEKLVLDTINEGHVVGIDRVQKYSLIHRNHLTHNGEPGQCLICDLVKITKRKIPSTMTPATRIAESLHFDIVPLPFRPDGPKHYWLLVIDEYSRYKWVFLLSSKDETIATVKSLILSIEEETKLPVTTLRSDQGTETTNLEFQAWCQSREPPIEHKPAPPYQKEYNGLAESAVKSVKRVGDCLRTQGNLPDSYRFRTYQTAVFILNRVLHSYIGCTPYEKWHQRKPNLANLRAFGCLVVFYNSLEELQRDGKGKHGNHGALGLFVGYKGEHIYEVYDLVRRTIVEKVHVRFHEDRFPGIHYTQQQLINYMDLPTTVPSITTDEVCSYWQNASSTSNSEQPDASTRPTPPVATEDGYNLRPRNNVPSSITPGSDHRVAETDLQQETPAPVMADMEIDEPDDFYILLEDTPDLMDLPFTEHSLDDSDNIAELQGGEDSSLIPLEEALSRAPVTLDPETNSAHIAIEDIPMSDVESEFSDLEEFMDRPIDVERTAYMAHFSKLLPNHLSTAARKYQVMGRKIHAELEHIKTDYEGLYQQLRKVIPSKQQSNRAQLRALTEEAKYLAKKAAKNMKNHFFKRRKKVDIDIRNIHTGTSVTPDTPIKVSSLPDAPMNLQEALDQEYRAKWVSAAIKEYESMISRGVWELVPKPTDRKVLKSKWVFAYKMDEHGMLTKFKGRIVAAGYSQVEGTDYKETFSAVVKIQSIRILLALAELYGLDIHQMDVATAFLYGTLDEPNYMEMPEGFQEFGSNAQPLVCKLIKSIYGLHQSSRVWGETLADFLISEGFTRLSSDSCVFKKFDKKTRQIIFVMVYVDDLLFMSSCNETIKRTKDALKTKFEMSDIGPAEYVLGISIKRFPNGMFFGQPNYTRELLESCGMWNDDDGYPINIKSSPMMTSWEHDPEGQPLSEKDRSEFLSILMKMAYLAQQSRPDILFAVNKLSQFQSKCNSSDQRALERILRYLRGTWDYGIFYTKPCLPMILNSWGAFQSTANLLAILTPVLLKSRIASLDLDMSI